MISMRVPLANREMQESCLRGDLLEHKNIHKIASRFKRSHNC